LSASFIVGDKIMSQLLEVYLQEVQKKGFWFKIGEFFAGGEPNSQEHYSIHERYWKKLKFCEKRYPDNNVNIHIPIGDKELKYDHFEENPKKVQCILHARYEFINELIELYETHDAEWLCGNNKYKDKCIQWVKQDFARSKSIQKQLDWEIKQVEKMGLTPNKQSQIIFNKLKHLN